MKNANTTVSVLFFYYPAVNGVTLFYTLLKNMWILIYLNYGTKKLRGIFTIIVEFNASFIGGKNMFKEMCVLFNVA